MSTKDEPRTVWNPPLPGCYHILINDEQRLALIEVLGRSAHQEAALEYWIDMLCDLPKVEQENPGILHGFSL